MVIVFILNSLCALIFLLSFFTKYGNTYSKKSVEYVHILLNFAVTEKTWGQLGESY